MELPIIIRYALIVTLLIIAFTLILMFVFSTINSVSESLYGMLNKARSQVQAKYYYSQIQKLKLMKKYIGISIVLFVIAIITLGSFIVFDSRDYFKKYFERQRDKIELASQQSVDSLKTVITLRDKRIDSLSVLISTNKTKFDLMTTLTQQLKEQNSLILKENKNLQAVVKHQNQMIDAFRKTK